MDGISFSFDMTSFDKRLDSYYKQQIENITRIAAKVNKAANAYGIKRTMDIFDQVVNEFYMSYEPTYYSRNGSLSKLIVFEEEPDGVGFQYGFDPGKMTGTRHGYHGDGVGGLYDTVFRRGWHGGAERKDGGFSSEDRYWRYPPAGITGVTPYTHWKVHPAERSDAPLSKFNEEIDKFFDGEYMTRLKALATTAFSDAGYDIEI